MRSRRRSADPAPCATHRGRDALAPSQRVEEVDHRGTGPDEERRRGGHQETLAPVDRGVVVVGVAAPGPRWAPGGLWWPRRSAGATPPCPDASSARVAAAACACPATGLGRRASSVPWSGCAPWRCVPEHVRRLAPPPRFSGPGAGAATPGETGDRPHALAAHPAQRAGRQTTALGASPSSLSPPRPRWTM